MNQWKISDAKARLSEVVSQCAEAPQLLYNRNKPVAALLDMDEYEAFIEFKRSQRGPTMEELFKELRSINAHEPEMDPLPPRSNRPTPDFAETPAP
jgi:prevent-host-death family protein